MIIMTAWCVRVRGLNSLGGYLNVKIYCIWEGNMTTRREIQNWARPFLGGLGYKRRSGIMPGAVTEVRVYIRMASNRLSQFPRVVECGSLREIEGNLMPAWLSSWKKGLRLPDTTFSNPYDGKHISSGAYKRPWSKRQPNYLHWYAQMSQQSTLIWIFITIVQKTYKSFSLL